MDVFEPSTRSDHFDTVCGCCCLIGFIVDKTQTDYGVTRLQRASVLCVCVFLCVCVCVCACACVCVRVCVCVCVLTPLPRLCVASLSPCHQGARCGEGERFRNVSCFVSAGGAGDAVSMVDEHLCGDLEQAVDGDKNITLQESCSEPCPGNTHTHTHTQTHTHRHRHRHTHIQTHTHTHTHTHTQRETHTHTHTHTRTHTHTHTHTHTQSATHTHTHTHTHTDIDRDTHTHTHTHTHTQGALDWSDS